MTLWYHSRKGHIRGELLREDDTWMWVRLSGEHQLRWMSEYNRGTVNDDGEVMCLRKSLAEVVEP